MWWRRLGWIRYDERGVEIERLKIQSEVVK